MAHPDLDQLLNAVLPFAKQMIEKHGEFYPFGSTMLLDGNINSDAAYDGNEHPLSQDVIDMLTRSFHQQAIDGKLRAAGICYDVRVIPPGQAIKTDAVCISLEHSEGQSIDVYLPYKKGLLGKIHYGSLFASERTPQFFSK
jgi:hypothetical protein